MGPMAPTTNLSANSLQQVNMGQAPTTSRRQSESGRKARVEQLRRGEKQPLVEQQQQRTINV